jgi:outer membrane protein assembly factor BamB
MTIVQTGAPAPRKPIRLWPGVVLLAIQWLGWFILPFFGTEAMMYGMLAGVICALLIAVWWLFLSRAMWLERFAAILLIVIAVIATKRIVHPSIAGGMMGMMLPIFSIPFLSLALVAGAAAGRHLSSWRRRGLMAAAILLACGAFTLVRTGGITGDADPDLHWRWTKSPEEKLLAQGDEPASSSSASSAPAAASDKAVGIDWPGFRGPKRDGVVRGSRIETDWAKQPPVAVWRRPIGPGWSSFAVRGNLVFTQEQRGEHELVTCYDLTTGKPVWTHRDTARFWESNAGAGPRGTPTLVNDRVYTFGATGILNALDIRNGAPIWSRNVAADTKTKMPNWGFASSPLVVGDVVIVAAASSLAAYDVATGNPRWFGPTANGGYSSPHLVTIAGVPQVLLVKGEGVISVNPADGTTLWKYAWEGDSIVQPALTADGDVLIGSGSGLGSEVGVLRLAVTQAPSGWTAKERWMSAGLKPYFNDFVVHKDNAFGFDGSSLACIDLKDGSRKWKGGSYGHGQIVLLADQDLMIVASEEGELALVRATPDQFTELARFKAINGKTWNHPVLAGDVLLVRNAEEMAAFRLALANR